MWSADYIIEQRQLSWTGLTTSTVAFSVCSQPTGPNLLMGDSTSCGFALSEENSGQPIPRDAFPSVIQWILSQDDNSLGILSLFESIVYPDVSLYHILWGLWLTYLLIHRNYFLTQASPTAVKSKSYYWTMLKQRWRVWRSLKLDLHVCQWLLL